MGEGRAGRIAQRGCGLPQSLAGCPAVSGEGQEETPLESVHSLRGTRPIKQTPFKYSGKGGTGEGNRPEYLLPPCAGECVTTDPTSRVVTMHHDKENKSRKSTSILS